MKIGCCVVRVMGRSDNWQFCCEFLCFAVRVLGHRKNVIMIDAICVGNGFFALKDIFFILLGTNSTAVAQCSAENNTLLISSIH